MKEMFEKFCQNGGTMSGLSRDIGENKTYVSKALNGWDNYRLSPERKEEIESKIKNYLFTKVPSGLNDYELLCKSAGILPFENTLNIFASFIKAIKQSALMSICAKSGTGKTTAINALLEKYPQVVRVTAYSGIRPKVVLEDVAFALGVKKLPKSVTDLLREVKRKLNEARRPLVIDEANWLSETSLEQLRHIYDVCNIPIVLVGTEVLEYTIARSHEQVASRIRESLPIKSFRADEVLLLAQNMGCECDMDAAKKVWADRKTLRNVKFFLEDCLEYEIGVLDRLAQIKRKEVL